MPAPVKKKKKFIDKKNAITFKLVHRSQRDPELANPDASEYVLEPVARDKGKVNKLLIQHKELVKKEVLHEIQREFGIYFNDDYNYLQHLKLPGQPIDTSLEPVEQFVVYRKKLKNSQSSQKPTSVQLPSSVFPSQEEEGVGLLNKAAPQGLNLSLDPDVIAALDDDFDFGDPRNKLDDDFILQANAPLDPKDEETDSDEDYVPSDECELSSNENDSEFGHQNLFKKEETMSRFSNFSLTSSVIRRNEKLKLLDDMFDKVFEQYGDDEIGALDGEDLNAPLDPDSTVMQMLLEEYEKATKDESDDESHLSVNLPQKTDYEKYYEDDDGETDELSKIVIEEVQKEWDCQSITSTYSNLYNHPKLIKVEPSKIIQVSQKTGIPKDVLSSKGLTTKQLAKLNKSNCDCSLSPTKHNIRQRGENPEERKARKQSVKEERRERRIEKKANKLAFKEETKEQAKILYNLQHNMNNIKLV